MKLATMGGFFLQIEFWRCTIENFGGEMIVEQKMRSSDRRSGLRPFNSPAELTYSSLSFTATSKATQGDYCA